MIFGIRRFIIKILLLVLVSGGGWHLGCCPPLNKKVGDVKETEYKTIEYDDPVLKGVIHKIPYRDAEVTYKENYDENKKASVIRFTLISKE